PGGDVAPGGLADTTVHVVLDGMTSGNAETRILLLARKLTANVEADLLFSATQTGSVEQMAEAERRGTGVVLRAVLSAVRHAREMGLPTTQILAHLSPIPQELLSRVRAWALREATDVPLDTMVGEIAEAIRHRYPTGDDVRLIDRIMNEAPSDRY